MALWQSKLELNRTMDGRTTKFKWAEASRTNFYEVRRSERRHCATKLDDDDANRP